MVRTFWNTLISIMLVPAALASAPIDPGLLLPRLDSTEQSIAQPDLALQANILPSTSTSRLESAARLALAWTETGLLIRADVSDTTPAEADTDSRLWEQDSLEIFIASPARSARHLQLVCSPGHDPAHPQPRWHYFDRQPGNRSLPPPILTPHVRPDGYTLSILVPWAALDQPPAQGDAISVQIYVNDLKAEGSKTRYTWFPSDTIQSNPAASNLLVLSDHASPPANATARLRIRRLRDVAVEVLAAPSCDGEPILVRDPENGTLQELGRLTLGNDGLCRGSVGLPSDLAGLVGRNIDILIGRRDVIPRTVPDLRAARLDALKRTAVAARPSVFAGERFPSIGFMDADTVEAAFGACDFKVRYFNRDFQEVSAAREPGRYAALVEIVTEDGLRDERRLNLFRTASRLSWMRTPIDAAMTLPPEIGLSAGLATREADMVSILLRDSIYNGMNTPSPGLADILVALDDIERHPDWWHGISGWTINLDWWSRLDQTLGQSRPYAHLLSLPEGYDTDRDRRWPLLLFLHGAGERGHDLETVRRHGPMKHGSHPEQRPFVIVCPQCPPDAIWSPVLVDELVEKICAEQRIDRSRLYVTGISMGGWGVWDLIGRYPDKYAAALPMASGALPSLAGRIKHIPIRTFSGELDDFVPNDPAHDIVTAIRALGGSAEHTVYPGVGHDAWTRTYEDPAIYEWLLGHHR